MYPVGFASGKEGEMEDEFYFLIKDEGWLGLKEDREISVPEWIEDQEIKEYNEIGDLFKEITMHEFFLKGNDLEPGQMEMFYLVCYNIDKFKEFIFKTSFLKNVIMAFQKHLPSLPPRKKWGGEE